MYHRFIQSAKLSRRQLLLASLFVCSVCSIVFINLWSDFKHRSSQLFSSELNSTRKIFFHETSNKGFLDERQACAVEAAARAHPTWDVHVIFLAPVIRNGTLKMLEQFSNVKFRSIKLEEYCKGTPLEAFLASGALNKSKYRVSHTSDVLRYATLYKYAGVYLDLDAIVLKSLADLRSNWAARESDAAVAAGAMSFSDDSLGRSIANKTIREIATNFRGKIWGNNGPGVITRVLKKLCGVEKAAQMNAKKCKGFEVYKPQLFYPVQWWRAQYYFERGVVNTTIPYIHHVWNRKTHDKRVTGDSRYANLARRFCPSVFEMHKEKFGVKSQMDYF